MISFYRDISLPYVEGAGPRIGFHQLIYSLNSHTPVHIEKWDNFLKNSSPGDTLTFEFLEWPGYGKYPGKRKYSAKLIPMPRPLTKIIGKDEPNTDIAKLINLSRLTREYKETPYPRREMMDKCMQERGDNAICI